MSLRSALGLAGVVYLGVLLSRVTGVLRETSISGFHGLSTAADTIVFSIFLPDLLVLTLATTSLGKVIIAELNHTDEGDRPGLFIGAILTAFVVFGLLAAALSLTTGLWLPYAAPQMDAAAYAQLDGIVRVAIFAFPFLGAAVASAAYLESQKLFYITAWRAALYNLLIIIGIFYSADDLSAFGPFILFAGLVVFAAMFLPAYRRASRSAGSGIILSRDFLRGYGAGVGISILVAVPLFVPYLLAAQLGEGVLAAYNFSYKLLLFPIGLCTVLFDIVLFPDLAARAAVSRAALKAFVHRLIGWVLGGTAVVALALYLFAPFLVELVFGYGAMAVADQREVARLFSVGTFAIVTYVLGSAGLSILLAMREQRAAFMMNLWSAVALLAIAVPGVQMMQATGLMWAFVGMSAIRAVLAVFFVWPLLREGRSE